MNFSNAGDQESFTATDLSEHAEKRLLFAYISSIKEKKA
jgi:hypothetical protein